MKRKLLYLISLLTISILSAGGLFAQTYQVQIGDKITTDDGIYVVSGGNLITNPNFDDGFDGWYAGNNNALSEDYFTIVEDGGPDGSPCLKALSSSGSGNAQSIKTGWAVEVGKTYYFSCWAKRPSLDGNAQYSRLFISDSQTATTTEVKKITWKAGAWAQTEYVFTAEKPYLVGNFGWLGNGTSFDCFFLGEVTVSDELSTAKLEDAIASAQSTYDTTEEGTGAGQYKPEVRQALADAIAAAQAVLASATTQDQINEAVIVLNAAVTTYKNGINPPFELGVGYLFTNVAAGINLSSADGTVRIKDSDPSDPKQVFYFEKAPEGAAAAGYNMKDGEGTYIYRSGSWDTKAAPDADVTIANAIFNIVDYGNYVQIKNMGSGSVLGTDGTSDNSAVYSNKNGSDTKYRWVMMKNTPTAALEAAIEKAQTAYEATEVGTEYYQVPQSAADELKAAIESAKAALETVSSVEESVAQAATLLEALDKFNNSYNPLTPFTEGDTYIIRHISGNLLTVTTSGNATITSEPEEGAVDEQVMTFIPVEGYDNAYYIRSNAEYTYLQHSGTWDTTWAIDNDTLACVISVEQLSGKYLGLKFVSTASYLGTDATSSGALTYSDKAGLGYTNSYWTVEPFVAVVLDRGAWNEALEAAQNALNNAKEGFGKGEFFDEDISTFRSLINTRRTEANRSKDQETLDGVTAQLLQDIEEFLAMAHADDVLDIRALRSAVTRAESTISSAVAGDLNGQYPQSAIDTFNEALKAAKLVLENEESTQQELDDAAKSLNEAIAKFAEEKVVIDYNGLREVIADAKQILADSKNYVGEGAGKYPQELYNALQVAVNNAETDIRNNTMNQDAVDELTQALLDQTVEYSNSRVPLDTSRLQELVDEARQLLADADDGKFDYWQEYYDDLAASVEKNSEALKSFDQDEIERAVKILSRDIEIFKISISEATGIESVLPADAVMRVYTLNGMMVGNTTSNLSKGIYIIQIEVYGKLITKKLLAR